MIKLNNIFKSPLTNTQIKRVADLVIHNTKTNIFKDSREQQYVEARALFNYLMREEFGQTLYNIRDYYMSKGKKYHHATILHSIKSFKEITFKNPHYLPIIEVIKIQEVSPRQINNLITEVCKIKTKKQLENTREFLKNVILE
tara:strand:- start:2985 stop:3413 length:429 start_codon:yes stop_codon:yes gene_type:complete